MVDIFQSENLYLLIKPITMAPGILFASAFILFFYFMPSIIGRNKRNSLSIFLLNLFLGWTFIGWIVAIIWACSSDSPPIIINNTQPQTFSKIEQLERLAHMHKNGVLSDDEFQKEKSKLLA